ncbi:DNA methyltransferase [Ferrimonas lipolytica]|uniref:Methyltransferase n=1 Tax=Ferrimonas lipolytica TaxID=2724191 RepID=A0A6H1UDI6_9GAMM|nr:DNA methyltransferase [Ferrimonas lipolytica]QIZ77104.1 site-specific DNA-methyltransferase [Ferrimonas lipolytica]
MSTFQLRQQAALPWLQNLGQQTVALAAFCLADNHQPLASYRSHNPGSNHNAWLELCPSKHINSVFTELYRVMQWDKECLILCNATQLGIMQLFGQAAGFRLGPLRVAQLQNRRGNLSQYYLLHFRKGRPPASWRQQQQLFQLPYQADVAMPQQLFESLLEQFTQPNDLVIDPFMLDGSIASYTLQQQRRFAGAQADSDKFDLLKRQLNALPDATELMRQSISDNNENSTGQIQLL